VGGKPYEEELADRRVRQEHLDAIVEAAMDCVMAGIAERPPALRSRLFYGASAIHPRHLVAWYVFNLDADWEAAKQNGLTSEIDRWRGRESR
jgi:hypothetical protein